jgi:hypothetical protein
MSSSCSVAQFTTVLPDDTPWINAKND